MPRLFVLAGPQLGSDHRIASGAVLGRDEGCEVVLEGLSISRRHARILESGGSWFVEDLGSRNGVRLGGRRVRRAELADFAELQLGQVPLRFRLDQDERADEPGGEELVLEGAERLDAGPPGGREPGGGGSAARDPLPLAVDERTQLLLRMRRETGSGLFTGDLAQRPLGVRLVLYLVALLVAGAALWLAYRGTLWLRGGS